MRKNLLSLLALAVMLPSCRESKPKITVVCEENTIGNSIVKWETVPALKGTVKVYASTDPDHFTEDNPVAMAPIANARLTVVTPDPNRRFYYRLVFADRHRVKVATRNVRIPGIQNFRDLGGYTSHPLRKQVRWGRIYRSAAVDSLPSWSRQELRNIGIRTVIDLRTPQEIANPRLLATDFNVVNIPITVGNTHKILQQIEEEQMSNRSVNKTLEKMYEDIVTECKGEFRQVFDLLLNADSYPVMMHCAMGKGRMGVMSALVLAAIGIDEFTIMSDYQLSNTYINIPSIAQNAYHLTTAQQEAITTLYSAHFNFLDASLRAINRQYGSIGNYLHNAIGLTQEEQRKLQALLLE